MWIRDKIFPNSIVKNIDLENLSLGNIFLSRLRATYLKELFHMGANSGWSLARLCCNFVERVIQRKYFETPVKCRFTFL